MFRLLFFIITAIFLISIIRMVAGVLMKGLGSLFEPAATPVQSARESVPIGGELKKDPVCGTFVSAAVSVKKNVGGSVMHFCSAECRDKFHE
jgi:YHS domain-containing protein